MKNINAKYKLMALIPVFVLTGCKKQEHKNVITEIGSTKTANFLLMKDIESGKEKAYSFSFNEKHPGYLLIGDTVTILTGGRFMSEADYKKHCLLFSGEVGISYKKELLRARKERVRLNQLKQKTR